MEHSNVIFACPRIISFQKPSFELGNSNAWMSWNRFAIQLVLALCISGVASDHKDKSVIISLASKWNSTSIVAETSEFIAKEDGSLFWKFTNDVAAKSSKLDWNKASDEQKYEFALEVAAGILDEPSMDILKLSLSYRMFSPAVHLFQQIASDYSVDCAAFFDVHGTTGCTAKGLEDAVNSASQRDVPELLSTDHVNGKDSSPKTVVIIYGDIGSQDWLQLHNKALELSASNKAQYVLRHFQKNTISARSVSLSGYGVELAIKNTEYKAVDDSNVKKEEAEETSLHGFNFKLLKELHPDAAESLDAFRIHLKEIEELAPLKQWQVQDLSFQASQRIVNEGAYHALDTLKELSQNFPTHARSIARESVSRELRQGIELNQKEHLSDAGLSPGESMLFLNGIGLDVDSLDMFQLVDTIKQEERVASGFSNMGFQREYLSILTGMEFSEEKGRYAVDYRDADLVYLNNLDTDKRYKHWRNSVKLLLEPYYPGMIRPIARNLFNLIFVVDPAERNSRNLMQIAYSFFKHEIPLRIGLIFVVNDDKKVSGLEDTGVAILNLFNFLAIDSTNHEALKIVNEMLDQFRTQDDIDPADIKSWFEENYSDADYKDVFGPNTDYDRGKTGGMEFLRKSAIGKAPKVLLNGYPLDDAGITGDKFEETVMMEVMRITPKLQTAVINGQLKDRLNVGNWIMEQKDVMPRHNERILNAVSKKNILDLSSSSDCKVKEYTDFAKLSAPQQTQCVLTNMKYFKKSGKDLTAILTLWIIADLDDPKGRELVDSALKRISRSNKIRLGLIMNPKDEELSRGANSVTSLVHAAVQLLPHEHAKDFVAKLMKMENVEDVRAGSKSLKNLLNKEVNSERFDKERKSLSYDRIMMDTLFARELVGLSPGQRAVVANGIIVGPFEEDEEIIDADFELLEKIFESQGAGVIAENVDNWKVTKEAGFSSDIVMRAFALISKYAVQRRRTWVVLGEDEHSTVTLTAEDSNRPVMDVVAVVDPLSGSAQKLAPILDLLRKAVNCDLKIVLNPKGKLSELPLKRFYRYVGAPELQFDEAGNVAANQAKFTNLPSKQLLTLSVHSPNAWMVESVYAEADLDNIRMESAQSDVLAEFSLEHILLEGHCFDEVSGSPPRGLQFVLGTPAHPTRFDTIVMANLGYFQLKASPGAWVLQLREGKSKDIYQLSESMEGDVNSSGSMRVLIDSFSGKTIRVRVAKKPGMEQRSLLASDDEEGGGIWSTISNTLVQEKHKVINVFSLASGHLYERFMNIMMLSVMKHTKKPVKFWLLKNYLSPQFKKNLPLLSAEYGFEYALVEYKWPRWLHQQKEKHRIMWGYKILFLDVLFPLDVQKIIFVDADQVVRADLMELMEYDLGGAPYGYVPFCDSRKEMDGFRFWKQGYWANHLAGRRYHISALYVIDLQKFRQIAAGDRLRGQYQGLSSDPNSLSNLDQDLPNNMIHQVKIKSLPQEWLWCETWCDDASKSKAKTIDLCNNPMTKEPKLESAIRIIPEWRDLDEEVKRVLRKEKVNITSTTAPTPDDEHAEL